MLLTQVRNNKDAQKYCSDLMPCHTLKDNNRLEHIQVFFTIEVFQKLNLAVMFLCYASYWNMYKLQTWYFSDKDV